MKARHKLTKLSLQGFKSIGHTAQKIEFQDVNILVGANGVGKSNLISFFQMLSYLTTDTLQQYVGKQGYADSLLYYGSKETDRFTAGLVFNNANKAEKTYEFALAHSYQGQMMFALENVGCKAKVIDSEAKGKIDNLGTGHSESKLKQKAPENKTAEVLLKLLGGCRVYQFHDTSEESRIRKPSLISDDRYLRSDAGNLSAYLYGLRQQKKYYEYYERIVRRIGQIMPQFKDFMIEPLTNNADNVRLDWIDKERQHIFGPNQISDGSLRFMALTTLLLQPPENLPNVVIIDEPELGLHPEAIIDLFGMISIAKENCQIVLATQSPAIIDLFDLDEIIIVERKDTGSIFRRLSEVDYKEWLQEYSVSELWNKNLIGGRP